MKLFIANCTKQNADFTYRIPETQKLTSQPILAGQQIEVYKDTSAHELQAIIDQHTMYGLVAAKDVKRTEAFIGMCYSLGQPVDIEAVMLAAEHNDEVLEKRGQEIREQLTGAIDHQVKTEAQEAGTAAHNVTVEIQEEQKPGQSGETFKQTLTTEPSGGKKGRR